MSRSERAPPSRAILGLARRLHWKMEHLDPSETDSDWDHLKEREQEFYCLCIKAILDERSLVEEALEEARRAPGII